MSNGTGRKMTKADLSEALAAALNLLMHIRASTDEGAFPEIRMENQFNELIARLPEVAQNDYREQWALKARDLA